MNERLQSEALAVAELRNNLEKWRSRSAPITKHTELVVIADMRDKHGFESSLYFSKSG